MLSFVLNLQKIANIYSANALKKYTIYIIQFTKAMGITTIRHYVIRKNFEIPGFYIEWSDEVLEIDRDDKGRIKITLIKSRSHRGIETIYDREIIKCMASNLSKDSPRTNFKRNSSYHK